MTDKAPKKKLQKPSLKKVPLAIEQAVLAGCKQSTMSAGPGSAGNICDNSLGMGQKAPCSAYGC